MKFWRHTPAKRLLRNWPLVLGLVGTLGLAFLVLWGPHVAPLDPLKVYKGVEIAGRRLPPYPPSSTFPLGTDRLGRDILSGLLAGARFTLVFAGLSVVVGLLLAVPVGLIAGWEGAALGRFVEAASAGASAVPPLLVAGLLIRAIQQLTTSSSPLLQVLEMAVVLGVVAAVRLAEVVRRLTLQVKREPYVEAAISAGASSWRIVFKHLLRNIIPGLSTTTLLEYAAVLRLLAVLALLRIYIVPQVVEEIPYPPWFRYYPMFPEWTSYMNLPFTDMHTSYWILLFPGLALTTAILVLQFLAAGLHRA